MATYRERREAKAERLQGWAGKREDKAAGLRQQNERYRGDHAFNTQPGHIPERARANARDVRAFEHANKAREMSSRAAGIESQLSRAIYSDDPDAVEALTARIEALEAEREQVKADNTAYRKEHGAELRAMTLYQRDQVVPHPRYVLANLGGNITRQRKRLALLSQPRRPRSVIARRDGECSRCDEPIRAGETITEAEPSEWVHAECAS